MEAAAHAMRLGGASADYLELVFGRPGPHDPDPDRWVSVKLNFGFGAFRGAIDAAVVTYELRDLLEGLIALDRDLAGTVRFDTLERQVGFTLAMRPTGQITFAGHVSDQAGSGNRLEFSSEFDQSYLPPAISALAAFLAETA